MVENKKILVYGSLRNNEYNFKRFKEYFGEGLKYIKTLTIEGYKLYDLGSYPGIKESVNNEPLVVDVMETSQEAYDAIYRMEIGAGYKTKTVTIEGEDHTIYVYQGNPRRLVESGDWSEYLSHEQAIEA